MKLLYYLPAIGDGNIEKKHQILLHNVHAIHTNIKQKFSIAINFYTVSNKIKESIQSLDFIETTYFYEKPGVLTELFLTSPANDHVTLYDYVLFVLDDVKLVNIDIPKMIEIKETHCIEILSPKIRGSTWPYMNIGTNLTIHNFLEVYCLLLTPKDFVRFCSIHTIENKWMWGVDLLFGFYNIKAGVINTYIASHELPSHSNTSEARALMLQYLTTHTPKYRSIRDIQSAYNPIRETIVIGPTQQRPRYPSMQ